MPVCLTSLRGLVLASALVVPVLLPTGSGAQETQVAAVENPQPSTRSGLPLPRYVSLKAERVNLRVGPGRDYAVSWLYLKSGLPMEIIQEYDLWRRVRDAEGTEGWVYHSLLSGERTAMAAPWLRGKDTTVGMHSGATADSTLVARLEPGVIAKVSQCSFNWCEIEAAGRHGFIAQTDIWGVYPDEKF